VDFKRVATTTQTPDHPGLTNDGVFETRRQGEISEQASGTTRSTVDAETPITQLTKLVKLDPNVLDQARTGANQDIIGFLRKPYIISSGLFGISDVYATFNYVAQIPHSLLYGIDVWKQKVLGNFAFRGTLVLTLQVNATRFQQGRYIMAWSPSGGGINALQWHRMHASTVCQATQLPHVEVDINCDSEATLRVPTINAQGWSALDFPGSSTYGGNGYIFITAYSPLQVSTGPTTAGWTLFGHWEDVEVAMPVAPQMDVRSSGKIRRKVRPAEAEQESQGIGPISSALQKVSLSASMLSGVPFLSSIAAPVSWASDILANVAKVWGFSRPHNAAATVPVTRYIMNRMTNADVPDTSTKLGFMDSNEIEDLPGFAGSDIDEMSLSYVGSISAWYKTVAWSASGAAGDTLIADLVSPRSYLSTTTVASTAITHLTPVAFVSNMFGLYRGSIKLTFKLVKTEFHTGRLMLVFNPIDKSVNAAPPNPAYSQSAFCHREIIDVRYGNEFSFIIPYMSLTPYRSTAGLDSAYGTVTLTILNELVAPANVPSTINILIEASAGPDFEWAEPCDFPGTVAQTFVPQMASRNDCAITTGVVGGAEINLKNEASRACVGERVFSFRSLLKRFTLLVPNSAITPASYVSFYPFNNMINYFEGVTTTSTALQPDAYNLIGSCYALSRGAVRLKFVSTDVTSSLLFAATVPMKSDYSAQLNSNFSWAATPINGTPSSYPYRANRAQATFRNDNNGGVEIEVPYYNRTHSTAVCDTYAAPPIGNAMNFRFNGPVPRVAGYVYFAVTPASVPLVYRAASDDHSFGLFMSVPPVSGYVADFVG